MKQEKYLQTLVGYTEKGKPIIAYTINPNHPDNINCGGQGLANEILKGEK